MHVLSGHWNYPSNIRFGAGTIKQLPEALACIDGQRPLLVTDPQLASLPLCAQIKTICTTAKLSCALFSDVQANPVLANIDAGVQAYHQHHCDSVIALGGGSALDAAKAIALMVGQSRPLWDFEDREDWYTRVNPKGMAPVVAIPTAAGTGSEVGRCSVITDSAAKVKKIIFHPKMLPEQVICDPELTMGLPAHITAAVGMDALSHNMEAFFAPGFHPMADGIALEGMRLIAQALPRAFSNGANLEARAMMLAASTMGATAFQKGLGAMHALSHPCGAILNTHHGLTNAIVMPYVLAYNAEYIEEKSQILCRMLNLASVNQAIQHPTSATQTLLNWVLQLREQLQIPHTLNAIGVETSHIEELAGHALVDPSLSGNPVALNRSELEALYLACIEGNLNERTA